MAVEFRCPDCRAKLRVPVAPDPGEDVECPKCGQVFPAPDLDDEADRPVKLKDDDDKPKKEKKKKKDEKPAGTKRRKAKKKKTSPALLAGIVVGGIVFIALVTVLLVWFSRRQPASVEMMYYLPEDTEVVTGFNIGHAQKYEKLFESIDKSFADAPFRRAFDAVGKALGEDPKAIMDYAVTGVGKTPGNAAIVLRTKKEFDPAKLAKLPGARKATAGGKEYYRVDPIDGVAFGNPRVFAPEGPKGYRLIVLCPGDMSESTFGGLVNGHKGNERAVGERMGPLAQKAARGTYWVLYAFGPGSKHKPAPPPKEEGPNMDKNTMEWQAHLYGLAGSAKGMAYKVSVGSRDLRFEWLVWYDDKEKAAEVAKKWKESEVAKGDDGDIRAVKWWPYLANKFGDKKAQTSLLNHLSFTSSGEVFIAKSEIPAAEMMMGMSNLTGRSLQVQAGVDPAKLQP